MPANQELSAYGGIFLLWCYVAEQGKADPGLGVKTDGGPLDLGLMAGECFFTSADDLKAFLDHAADVGHIHTQLWRDKGIIFLPAMWQRVSGYYKNKGKKQRFDTAQQVVDAVLLGGVKTGRRSPRQANSGHQLPERATDKTNKTNTTNRTGKKGKWPAAQPADNPGLLDDAGTDQVQALVNVWNAERKPGPKVEAITPERRKQAGSVLQRHPNLEDWRKLIRWVNGQKWANASGTGEHANYRMPLDHLLRPGKFQQLVERMNADQRTSGDHVGRDLSRGRTGHKPGQFAGLGDRHETGS